MNRKNVMTLVMLTAFGTSAFAVGFLGSPTAEIGQGKWSIGYDYSYSSQDTDKVTATFEILAAPPAAAFKFSMKDFKMQRHYATIGYGLTDEWDVYLKLGVSDLKSKGVDHDLGLQWSMNFDNKFAWGWGTRYTLFQENNIAWGASVQMNWTDTDVKKRIGADINSFSVDAYDILFSVGPTVDMGGWKIYGGPFYYYLNGDYEAIYQNPADAIELGDIRAARNWGGFIGSVIDLGQNCKWTVEYNTTGKGWGLGTGIAWTF